MIDHWILAWLGLEVTRYVCFILVIAGAVQLVEMYVRKFFPSLYDSFGIFLPLITTNCAILGLCLFISLWGINNLLEAVVLSFGAGIGFTMAICIMAGIRENLKMADVPESLKGAPITLITAGLLTLAFMGFAGMIR
jgi:electron transport complex protein RnfA